jgi:hypothetical protein
MERTVPIKLNINGELVSIDTLPLSWDELASIVHKTSKLLTFNILYQGVPITNTRELVLVYLNHFGDELVLEILKGVSPMADMDEGVQEMYEKMYNQFEQLRASPPSASVQLQIQNGSLSKPDLLKVIQSLIEKARVSLFETGKKFVLKRQEFYGHDDDHYKKVVMEQMEFQEMLIISSTTETINYFGINNQIFEESVKKYNSEPDVRIALESMAVESILGTGAVPDDLTREKLKEILLCSCDFVQDYVVKHPNMHPMDILILKSREADEVYKKFNYDEFQVSAAMTRYNIETDPYFEDIRNKLNQVTVQLFGFNPAEINK